jgi:hypothetical protein
LAIIKKKDLKDFVEKMLQSGQILRKRFLKLSYFDIRVEAPAGGPNIARFLNFPWLSSLNCSQI